MSMMILMVRPVLQFRVYPAKGALYLLVSIFETKKDMYAYCAKECAKQSGRVGKDFDAIVHTFKRIDFKNGNNGHVNPMVGHMHFTRRRLTMEIVTHESGHAALAYFRRKYRREVDVADIKYEEALCYALGKIGLEIVGRTRKVTIE